MRSCGGDGSWWWWRTPRSGHGLKRRWSSREYGVGVESGTGYGNENENENERVRASTLECGYVPGQHAGERDPMYWPHERVGREVERRGSMP